MREFVMRIKEGKGAYGIIKKKVMYILTWSIPVNNVTKPFYNFLYNVHIFIRESLSWLIRIVYFEPLFRSQCNNVGKRLWMEKLPYIVGKGEINVGDNVRLSGKPNISFNSKIYSATKLSIGNNTFVGHGASFVIAKEIKVGNNCSIAGLVRISDNDGHPLDACKRRQNQAPDKDSVKEVIIGDDVWIGESAVVLKGVKIGERAIIGTNAVVTKDVEPDTVVAGNPAKVIRNLV